MVRREFIQMILGSSIIAGTLPFQNWIRDLKPSETKLPVLFIGHGSPMNGIENNIFSRSWKELGEKIETPKAVLVISAHWLTNGTRITAMQNPTTIHDFGGFPQELFDVQYPAPGDPELAKFAVETIKSVNVELDHDWGLDHGAWSVVRQMYPLANIPVLQLSIDYSKPASYHYALAQELASLRKKGILIIGSGNMVHNLGLLNNGNDPSNEYFGFDWAHDMNQIFKTKIMDKDHKSLINYKSLSSFSSLAIPSPDHYYPLIYTLALQDSKESIEIFNDYTVLGSITMTSLKIGEL